jgi:hypothetical protein
MVRVKFISIPRALVEESNCTLSGYTANHEAVWVSTKSQQLYAFWVVPVLSAQPI